MDKELRVFFKKKIINSIDFYWKIYLPHCVPFQNQVPYGVEPAQTQIEALHFNCNVPSHCWSVIHEPL